MTKTVGLVIPCFNEAARLDAPAFAALPSVHAGLRLWFVDDASTDDTAAALERLRASSPARIEVLRLERNGGKAEAVRRGLLAALASGADVVGYADADLATPPAELVRMMDDLEAHPVAVLLGARIRFLGTRIERRAARHYVGRALATLASLSLGIGVYDTQCGAKLFVRGPVLEAALARPFRTRWVFDVELLDRLLRGSDAGRLLPEDLRELPLREWRDVRGSTLRFGAMLAGGLQVIGLALRAAVLGPASAPRRRGRRDGADAGPRAG